MSLMDDKGVIFYTTSMPIDLSILSYRARLSKMYWTVNGINV